MAKDAWDPFQELVQLRKSFSELFERSMTGMTDEDQTPSGHWSPPVDVFLDQDVIEVRADLPGINKEEVDIQLKGNKLYISGSRKPSRAEGQAFFHRIERQYGPFERVMTLNQAIDVGNISAKYEDGVLIVDLPVRHGPVEKKIELKSGD